MDTSAVLEAEAAAVSVAIVERLSSLYPDGAPLHEPSIGGNAWDYVKECLDTGWVSSAGKFVDRFEQELAAFTGASHVVATVNGTAALHSCLILAGVDQGDEVIVPAMTFVATANAVSYCGAVPHLVDSELATLGMDPGKLAAHLLDCADISDGACINRQTGRRISAAICMDTLGHPADYDRLAKICDDANIALIDDAAEALGSYSNGAHVGSNARLAALSFNGNKIATTGGGGAILTNDPDLAARARSLTTTAKRSHAWEFTHDAVGYNYRIPNINAALGCAQLEQMPDFLSAKRTLANCYMDLFSDLSGVTIIREPQHARSNYWLNAILLDPRIAGARDDILQKTNGLGIQTRPAWTPMHRLPMYETAPRSDLSVAEELFDCLIDLPSGAALAPAEMRKES
ncbi:MAG: LegC family aminotransferase [Rhodospirillaceae bacterium]|jgi:perosamine synthetase|nr:LegC family aminotransferase [Rhodospirillaceae bacterium]